jgi:hypothetical protein
MQDQVKCRRFTRPVHLLAVVLFAVSLIAVPAAAQRVGGKEVIPPETAPKAEKVEVLRGQPQDFKGVGTEIDEAALSAFELVPTGRGWFIDRKNNRLGNCYRASTGYYKERQIKCIWKDLP